MFMNAILFIALIVGGTALLSWPLGRYMKWAMDPRCAGSGLAGRFTPRVPRSSADRSRASRRTGSVYGLACWSSTC